MIDDATMQKVCVIPQNPFGGGTQSEVRHLHVGRCSSVIALVLDAHIPSKETNYHCIHARLNNDSQLFK